MLLVAPHDLSGLEPHMVVQPSRLHQFVSGSLVAKGGSLRTRPLSLLWNWSPCSLRSPRFLLPRLCAAAGVAAVAALVAGAAADHDRAARRAGRRVFLVLNRRVLV